MKRTPVRGVKQNLKSCVYKLWAFRRKAEPPHAFCIMSLRVALCSKVKLNKSGAGAKASANSAL